MHCNYKDITEKLGQPEWYDVLGFPRYCKFHPDEVSNIYADVVIYYLIQCQACGVKFQVAENYSTYNLLSTEGSKNYLKEHKVGNNEPLSYYIVPYFKSILQKDWGFLHYGDPPIHNCVGDTMNCEDLQITEFWVRGDLDWIRVKELEFNLPDMMPTLNP